MVIYGPTTAEDFSCTVGLPCSVMVGAGHRQGETGVLAGVGDTCGLAKATSVYRSKRSTVQVPRAHDARRQGWQQHHPTSRKREPGLFAKYSAQDTFWGEKRCKM